MPSTFWCYYEKSEQFLSSVRLHPIKAITDSTIRIVTVYKFSVKGSLGLKQFPIQKKTTGRATFGFSKHT